MQSVPYSNSPFLRFGTVIDRAVLTGADYGALLFPNGLNFGLDWSITLRAKKTDSRPHYVVAYAEGSNVNSEAATIIVNYVTNTYELYSTRNNAGGTVRLAANIPITDTLYHEIKFVYANSLLSAFVDGSPAGTLSVANFTPSQFPSSCLGLGQGGNNSSFVGGLADLKIIAGGVTLVSLNFDEASGDALNAGTLGGTATFFNGGVRELV